jgi:ubiquinone/menaquinone biosynthesis C-methylase UbiE
MSGLLRDEARCSHITAWESTPAGRYALQQERALLLHMVSPWRQRKQCLLELGCGNGYFQKVFQEAGFDVAGLECHPRLLQQSRERLGSRGELYYGQVDSVPFQDKEFDYAALLTLLPFCESPGKVMAEAIRVSRKGVLIGALNRHSLFGLKAMCAGRLRQGNGAWQEDLTWWSWPQMRRFLRSYPETARLKARSVLPGPMWSWRQRNLCNQVNSRFYPPGWGAILVIRLDTVRPRPVTPLLAWAKQPGTIPS